MSRKNRLPEIGFLLVLATIGVVKAAFIYDFLLVHIEYGTVGDASDYILISKEISAGTPGWYDERFLIRAPGYPAFLAVLRLVGVESHVGFIISNVVIGFATAVLCYDIGRKLFGVMPGRIAGLIVSLEPTLFVFQTLVLTETLFAFLLVCVLWLLVRLFNDTEPFKFSSVFFAIATGLVVVMALFVRHVLLYFAAFLAAACFIQAYFGTVSWKRSLLVFLVSAVPCLIAANLWSAHNKSTLGISAIRAVGQHLYLWRAPAIIERATGEDRWSVRARLTAQVPAEVESDLNALDEFQKEKFVEIVLKYPVAFAKDTTIGTAKILLAPSQAYLQKFFSEAFAEKTTFVDFVGLDRTTLENWNVYLRVAPGYLVVLGISFVIVVSNTLGAILAVIRAPSATSDTKAWIAILVAFAAYFILFSSSSSLDSRFRTPFVSALALLSGFGFYETQRSIADWFKQSGLRKHLTIAWTIVRSGDYVAYQAGAMQLLRLVVWPIDFMLSWFSWGSPQDKGPSKPVIFIVGIHRSGTTVLAQLLLQRLVITPLANLSVLFPNSPIVYFCARPWLHRPSMQPLARSFYGFSSGLLGISDVYAVWDRWFGTDHSFPRQNPSAKMLRDLRAYFSTIVRAANAPVLAKNNRLTLSCDLVAAALPEAVFVVVSRDEEAVVGSVLRANKAFYGDERFVWGLRPTDDFPRYAPRVSGDRRHDAHKCAQEQHRQLVRVVEEKLAQLPESRIIRVRFERLMEPDGQSYFDSLIEEIKRSTGNNLEEKEIFPPISDTIKLGS